MKRYFIILYGDEYQISLGLSGSGRFLSVYQNSSQISWSLLTEDFPPPPWSSLRLLEFWDREQKQSHVRSSQFKDVVDTASNFFCPEWFTRVIFKYCLPSLWLKFGFVLYFKQAFALKIIMMTFGWWIVSFIAVHSIRSCAGWHYYYY